MPIEQLLHVEPIVKDDPKAIAMLEANKERNALDPVVLSYPSSLLLQCSDGEKVMGVMITQSVQMLESIALNETMTSEEKASAAMNLMAYALNLAHQVGQREAYFCASDPVTERAMKQMGWQLVEYSVYRLRLDFVKEPQ